MCIRDRVRLSPALIIEVFQLLGILVVIMVIEIHRTLYDRDVGLLHALTRIIDAPPESNHCYRGQDGHDRQDHHQFHQGEPFFSKNNLPDNSQHLRKYILDPLVNTKEGQNDRKDH